MQYILYEYLILYEAFKRQSPDQMSGKTAAYQVIFPRQEPIVK